MNVDRLLPRSANLQPDQTAGLIDLARKLYRLAADLAILDVAE